MRLAFCGLGLMGSAMVQRLLQAGHEVLVWNRTAGKSAPLQALGARVAATPAEAAAGADGVLLCLMNAAAVEAVVFGEEGVTSGVAPRWLADHSTIAPDATRRFAQRLADQGGDWIDAPVSGGIDGAARGDLAIMTGGATAHQDEVRAALSAYGARITHLGGPGAGQAAKLCNQTIVASTVAAIGEAVALAHASGIDVGRLTEALSGGWADSRLLQVFVSRMIHPQRHSIGALATMLKDVDSVMSAAAGSGTPMPVTAAVQQALRVAAAHGLAEAELSALVAIGWPEQMAAFRSTLER